MYTIQISSHAPMEITHMELYLSYPIKIRNGIKENPFKVQGQASKSPANLNKGQSVQFSFNAPIKEVYGNSKILDFNKPEIKVMGYIKEGDKEIPFAIGGDLDGLLDK